MFNLRNVVLSLHIITAIMMIGWLSTDGLFLPGVIRRGDLAALQWAGGLARKIGPSAGVVFLLGLWLVLRDSNDAYKLSTKWIGMAMVLFIVAMVNGAVFIGKTAEKAGKKLATGEPATAEASRIQLLGLLNIAIVVVIVWLMVAKPT